MSDRLQYLFERYLNKTNTAEEERELMGLALEEGQQEQLKNIIYNAWAVTGSEDDIAEEKAEAFMENIFPQRRVYHINWRRIAAAASVLLVIGLGSYFLFFKSERKDNAIAKNVHLPVDIKAPQSNKATITLANGKKVYLDSIKNGALVLQAGVDMVKMADGNIVYKGISSEISYNTLSNPRGSNVINITLQDGSKVWLNSESSIKYPTAFYGKERKVELTGEAYFEVAHNAAMPFKVNVAGKEEVEVLGTHFNINSYEDEPSIRTTLLEGSVKVTKNAASILIKPGEQALVARSNNNIAVEKTVDLDAVMAWKNGYFSFQNAGIKSIMTALSRWYNVEVIYEGTVPQIKFSGELGRNLSLKQVLSTLQELGIHYKIDGNKLLITQ